MATDNALTDLLSSVMGGDEPQPSGWVTRNGDPYEYRRLPDGTYQARRNGETQVANTFNDAPKWLERRVDAAEATATTPQKEDQGNAILQTIGAMASAQGGRNRLAATMAQKGLEGTRKAIKDIWYDTLDESHEKYGKSSVEGDAYRHYESSRRTAQQYGPLVSLIVGAQHEAGNVIDFMRGKYRDDYGVGDLLSASGMDMANNLHGVLDGTVGAERDTPEHLSTMDRTYQGR